jgi:hypothetical protein
MHIWIVEMKFEDSKTWEPTVGCTLTREDGRKKRKHWEERCPCDKFKLTKYVPADKN